MAAGAALIAIRTAIKTNNFLDLFFRYSHYPLLISCQILWRPVSSQLFEISGLRDATVSSPYPLNPQALFAYSKVAKLTKQLGGLNFPHADKAWT